MTKIFLNFDFYGAGNIGDDLMLDGFLEGMKDRSFEYYCCLPRDFYSQQLRFPQINFLKKAERDKTAEECSIWIGAGDTPVQVKSGSWFMDSLIKDSLLKKDKNIKYYFIGVGAESEAVSQKENYRKILKDVDHIWTRDEATSDILKGELEVGDSKISTASDLANISLNKLFKEIKSKTNYKYDLGLCYFDEEVLQDDSDALKLFLKQIKSNGKSVLIFGNEVRKDGKYEYRIYERMFSRLEKLFGSIKYYQPDYDNAISMEPLVEHYSECEVIMSSRFHSLLTAAWAGCRVVALERSSKVSALAKELGIEEVKKPFTQEKLTKAFESSKRVEKSVLDKFYINAVGSTEELKKLIAAQN